MFVLNSIEEALWIEFVENLLLFFVLRKLSQVPDPRLYGQECRHFVTYSFTKVKVICGDKGIPQPELDNGYRSNLLFSGLEEDPNRESDSISIICRGAQLLYVVRHGIAIPSRRP